MIRLDTTGTKLQAKLAGAAATTEPKVVVCYSDKTATAYTGGKQIATLNGSTEVDICDAPAVSTVRDVDYINIRNLDTAQIILTVLYDVSGTNTELQKFTLQPDETLTYTHGDGWKVLDANGNTKTIAGWQNMNTVNAQTGTSYTLTANDNGKIVTLNNASAITLTVPSGLGANFNCLLVQLGAGQVTIAGSGATVNATPGLKLRAQYSTASLFAYLANTFVASGDLST